MPADRLVLYRIRVSTLLLLSLTMTLVSCRATYPNWPSKIALLAPFEGQYSEIGYNALYAFRLALGEAEPHNVQLLAVDDGGAVESAVSRVKALNVDPDVAAIIALGPAATHASTQMANDKPLILIGNWGHDRADSDSLYATNPNLAKSRQSGDLLMLIQARDIQEDLDDISFVSSGALPDANFSERYVKSALYAPPPNLLATLTYDIAHLALAALANRDAFSTTAYGGINGRIRFDDGYWVDAPINRYQYDGDELVLASD